VVIFAFYSLYDAEYLFVGVKEYGNVVNACTMGLASLVLYSFVDRGNVHELSRGWLVMVWGFSIAAVTLMRFTYRRVIHRLRERGYFARRALIIGPNREGVQVARQLLDSPNGGIQVVGLVGAGPSEGDLPEGLSLVGELAALEKLIERHQVQELIVIPSALDHETLLGIYRDWGTSNNVQVRLSSGLYELFTTGVQVKQVGFVPLLSLDRIRITGIDSVLKSITDYTLAALGVVMLSPLLAFLAVLIRRDSCGPVIYRRRVVGLHGKEFGAFKFRTMIPDADACLANDPELKKEWDETGKIQNDPRITQVGRVLRRFSLDELPQLFNVLRGEMSLVGPRMITPPELRHFGPWQHNLLTVKPGMTGLWQVSGRSDVSYDERVRLDMYYIRNYTIWLDFKLLVNTVTAVLAGKGAY